MKKINLKKWQDILFCIFSFIIIFSIIIVKPLSDLDEIWNYNTARAVSIGLIPYKDISLITTPFLPIFTAIILRIFGNEIIVSRVLAAILWTGIFFTTYKILEKLFKEENFAFIVTIIIGIICRDIFCIDYNVAVLLISLIILYMELNRNNEKKQTKIDYIIGILAGIAICTKQSIGLTLSFVVVLYNLLLIKNKDEAKEYLKISLKRIVGILIPVIIMILYLLITGAMNEFINYAILGIKTFSNKIPYYKLFENSNFEIRILSKLVPIFIILTGIILLISKISKKQDKKTNNLFTIFIYSFSIIIVMYPIADKIHFLLGSYITIIEIAYLIYLLGYSINSKIKFKKKLFIYKTITLIGGIALSVFAFKFGIENTIEYAKQDKNTDIKHYKYIYIPEIINARILKLDDYISECEKQGKKVYILDAEAALYMIPIDKYNKDYDMFLKGNIGKDGEQGQIEKIEQSNENCLYLIRKKEYNNNWQTPTKVLEHIRNSLEKVDEIEIFDVYEK